jgi:MFS family permease
MNQATLRLYPYRWVLLGAFALLNAIVQLNWIAFAPITVECMRLYDVSAFRIVLLSMSFMVIYIVVSIPASLVIDRYGIRVGVGIGAVLTGVFGYLRGVWADDYGLVALAQFGLATAQPFVLNAVTKVAADWFPINQRATANGVAALGQFLGIIVGLGATNVLARSYLAAEDAPLDIASLRGVLTLYGIASAAIAALFLVVVRNKPPTPPARPEDMVRYGVLEGMRHIFKTRDMRLLLALFFIGLGMFNAITTFIDITLASKGYPPGGNEAGNVGATMMLAGVLGAIVFPIVSDRLRRRRIILIICMAGVVPGLAGLFFLNAYVPLLLAAGLFGFFMMGAAPVGFQYAAEVSQPAPESTAQGLIVMAGQISGAIFIVLMAVGSHISIEALADPHLAPRSLTLVFHVAFVALPRPTWHSPGA